VSECIAADDDCCITEDDDCFLPHGRSMLSIIDGRVLREVDAIVRPRRDWQNVETVHLCESVAEFMDKIGSTGSAWP
jgi:hypothetical protein